jgi:hypothetical protein
MILRKDPKSFWRAAIFTFVAFSATTDAAVVRGRLVHGGAAAAGVSVTVLSKANGNAAPAVVTATDGMYYIYNISPGAYSLVVWPNGPSGTSTRYPINVAEPSTDVPAIALP